MMRKVVLILTLLAFGSAALIPAVANAVWKYKVNTITWDTTKTDGKVGGGGRVVIEAYFLDTDAPADTFPQNFILPLTMSVTDMRDKLDEHGKKLRTAKERADSIKTQFEGIIRDVP